jgi:O-antigen/teichoic acid export membrane protein
VSGAAILLAPELVAFFGGPTFAPAVTYMIALASQAVFRLPSQPFGAVLQAFEDTRTLLIINVGKYVSELLLYVVLIPIGGAVGACAAVVLSYAVAFAWAQASIRRHLPMWHRNAARTGVLRILAGATVTIVALLVTASTLELSPTLRVTAFVALAGTAGAKALKTLRGKPEMVRREHDGSF